MKLKKLAALAVSLVMAVGMVGVIPVDTDFEGIAVTASAASDFTIKTDSDGLKYVSKYNGNGGDIKIPDGVSYVGKGVFEDNRTITTVTFPSSCVIVEENAFSLCAKLRKVVFEGDICICANAFEKCVSLESVTVNGSILVGISAGAFRDCQALSSVKIKEDKEDFWIGAYAFYNCYSLIKINIPSKCTEIFTCAFMNCFSLTSLTIPAKTKITDNYDQENVQNKQFGYVQLFPTEEDCLAYIEGEEDYNLDTFLAGGKSGYSEKYTRHPGTSYLYYYEAAEYSPKAITLTVTKGSPAEERGIEFSAHINVPDELPIQDTDISVLLGNLLENAVEAASSAEGESRRISLNIGLKGKMLAITVDNGYSGDIKQSDGKYLSSKSERRGLGLESVSEIAEKYGGGAEFHHNENMFFSSVMLIADVPEKV